MSIKVGDPAPPVTVEAYVRAEADPVTMDIGRPGGSWTVLFFYPRDFTFVCPTELRGFAELEADFALEGAGRGRREHRLLARTPRLARDEPRAHRDPLSRDRRPGRRSSPASTACSTTTTAPPCARRSSSIPSGSSARERQDANVGRNPEETLRILKALRTGELSPVSWKPASPRSRSPPDRQGVTCGRLPTAADTLRRTPLFERHERAGARLVPFAGWEMPVQYEGIRQEHVAVRTGAGVFDVSHMGEIETSGPQAEAFLQRILSNDVTASPSAARSTRCSAARTAACSTTCSPTASGDDRFLTVTNASNHEKDLAWFREPRRRLRRGGPRTRTSAGRCSPSRARSARGGRADRRGRAAGADAHGRAGRRGRGLPRLRHGLHRRGRRRDPDPAGRRDGRSGTRCWSRA